MIGIDDDLGNLSNFLIAAQGLGSKLWLHIE
jgi:hypothetical protein